jgi:hypothetical protein
VLALVVLVIGALAEQAGSLVTTKNFHPSLMFVDNGGANIKCAHLKRLLHLPQNNKKV